MLIKFQNVIKSEEFVSKLNFESQTGHCIFIIANMVVELCKLKTETTGASSLKLRANDQADVFDEFGVRICWTCRRFSQLFKAVKQLHCHSKLHRWKTKCSTMLNNDVAILRLHPKGNWDQLKT